jgi:hypothetical protein
MKKKELVAKKNNHFVSTVYLFCFTLSNTSLNWWSERKKGNEMRNTLQITILAKTLLCFALAADRGDPAFQDPFRL